MDLIIRRTFIFHMNGRRKNINYLIKMIIDKYYKYYKI